MLKERIEFWTARLQGTGVLYVYVCDISECFPMLKKNTFLHVKSKWIRDYIFSPMYKFILYRELKKTE